MLHFSHVLCCLGRQAGDKKYYSSLKAITGSLISTNYGGERKDNFHSMKIQHLQGITL